MIVEVLVFALVPDLHGFAVAAFFLADAHAFGIVTIGAEGRGARRADHFISAFVAFFLLFEALLQRLHDFFPAAEFFDLGFFFFGQEFLSERLQPFFGQLGGVVIERQVQSFEDMTENLIEFVEVALVLHQRSAGKEIEILHLVLDDVRIHRFEQHQILAQRDGHIGFLQFMEEMDEHGTILRLPVL